MKILSFILMITALTAALSIEQSSETPVVLDSVTLLNEGYCPELTVRTASSPSPISPAASPSQKDPSKSGELATLATSEMMTSYLQESLSPVPVMMFAPVSVRLAFVPMVNDSLDETGNTFLHLASRSGDPFYTWQLLQFGANPAQRNDSHRIPLDVLHTGISEAEKFLLVALSPSSSSLGEIAARNVPAPPMFDPDKSVHDQADATPVEAGSTMI